MDVSRRSLLGSAAAAGLIAGTRWRETAAQDATPPASSGAAPGVAIARVRKLSSVALSDAIYPDVMRTFLPATAAVPGFLGYVYAFHATDPTASITVTLLRDDAAADAAEAAARDYVGQLDPRFVVETPVAVRGPVRIYATTERPRSALPPFLHGCAVTMRQRTTAPGADMDDFIARATSGLVPLLRAMPGFILYCWFLTEGGRTAINIWETDEQLAAGNEAVAVWLAEHAPETAVGDPVVNEGHIGYGLVPDIRA
jgi:hypothetical protein